MVVNYGIRTHSVAIHSHYASLHQEHHNTKLVDRVGLEPTTLGLKVRYSSQLS